MAVNDNMLRFSFDAAHQFKDAGLIAASAAAQVSSANKIVDVGNAVFEATMVIDVSAIEIDTGNERFEIIVQGSASATFASGIENLAVLELGAASSGRHGSGQDSVVGRYNLPFVNVQRSTTYRYLRVYTYVSGTIATGINYTANAGKKL